VSQTRINYKRVQYPVESEERQFRCSQAKPAKDIKKKVAFAKNPINRHYPHVIHV
jgi:hypothetical protein